MWIGRFRNTIKDSIFGEAGAKFNVNLTGYPISHETKKNKLIVQFAGLVLGEEKNKEQFKKYITKKVKNVYVNKDFMILLVELPLQNAPLYSSEIIWIKPALISNGYEHIEVASFERKNIINLFECLKKYGCELLELKKAKISNISLSAVFPEVTDKQKEALRLAIKEGYYELPKKIDLKKLAKISKVSYSTYQMHLKKAENKILPCFFNSNIYR